MARGAASATEGGRGTAAADVSRIRKTVSNWRHRDHRESLKHVRGRALNLASSRRTEDVPTARHIAGWPSQGCWRTGAVRRKRPRRPCSSPPMRAM
jgi:hypothetical protein